MITINVKPNMLVEPGHQLIVLPYDEIGRALTRVLTGDPFVLRYFTGTEIQIPHDENVDARIVALIDALAHVRYQAKEAKTNG